MTEDAAWTRARFHDMIAPELFARARLSTGPFRI